MSLDAVLQDEARQDVEGGLLRERPPPRPDERSERDEVWVTAGRRQADGCGTNLVRGVAIVREEVGA